MQFDSDTILIILNIVATVGGMIKMWISFERRLTIMETRLEYHLPKRRHDRTENDNG